MKSDLEYHNKIKNEIPIIRKILSKHFSEEKFKQFDIDSKIYLRGLIEDLEIVFDTSKPQDTVLDIGAGKGHISALLSLYFDNVKAIDLERSTGEGEIFSAEKLGKRWQRRVWSEFESNYNIRYSFYDGKKLPFKENTFDVLVAYAVIEHVDSIDGFLNECYRVLKEDGKLFIFRCPQKFSFTENFAKLLSLPHHSTLFSKKELQMLANKNKFLINSIEKYDLIPAFLPSFFGRYINCLSPILIKFETFLKIIHFNFFAHNWRIILLKGD